MRKCSIHYRLLIELKTLIVDGGANIFTAILRGNISFNKFVGSDYLWLTYRAPHSDIINWTILNSMHVNNWLTARVQYEYAFRIGFGK